MKLYSLGITNDQDAYLQRKFILTNKMSLMCAVIGFVYAPFLFVHYQSLSIIPTILFVFSSLLLVLSHFGFNQISRFLVAIEMLILASIFHAAIIPATDTYLYPFFTCMTSMTIIPWVLYDFREKGMLILTVGIANGLLLINGYLNELIELPNDPTFFRESYLSFMTYACGFVILALSLIMIKGEKNSELN